MAMAAASMETMDVSSRPGIEKSWRTGAVARQVRVQVQTPRFRGRRGGVREKSGRAC